MVIYESAYNETARQMLDHYYPKALQWCSSEEISDDAVNIGICMSYPNVLLNTFPIPLYSIHDVVEKFNCKSDLNLCSEFYTDETVINYYNATIIIEAGFYNVNLVNYLVDVLHVHIKQINHKITTKRALDPNTSKNYLISYLMNSRKQKPKGRPIVSLMNLEGSTVRLTMVLYTMIMILSCVVGHL